MSNNRSSNSGIHSNFAGPKLIGSIKSRAFRCLWMLEELGGTRNTRTSSNSNSNSNSSTNNTNSNSIGTDEGSLFPYQFIYAPPQSTLVKTYNPLGKIPILLEDDGFILYESSAILTYLGDKYNYNTNNYPSLVSSTPPTIDATTTMQQQQQQQHNLLVPLAGTQQRGRYEQTMSVLQTELDAQGLWIHRKHEVMGQYFTYIPEAVQHARKYFNKTNRILRQQLQENRNNNQNKNNPSSHTHYYLLGSHFTAVDIVYIHCLQWSQDIGWDTKWKDDEIIVHYLQVCTSRRAYQKTAAIKDDDNDNDNDNDNDHVDTDYQKKKQLQQPPSTTITKHKKRTHSISRSSITSKL